jgi:hypothetical protein
MVTISDTMAIGVSITTPTTAFNKFPNMLIPPVLICKRAGRA